MKIHFYCVRVWKKQLRLVHFNEVKLVTCVKRYEFVLIQMNDEQYQAFPVHSSSQFQEIVSVFEDNRILPISRRHQELLS
jgi:hypothetical protein